MAKNKEFRVSKSGLAIVLSRLEGFYEGKVRIEQYTTPSEIAAEVLWNAYLLGDIEGKDIADLGCGTGVLGIGAGLLGAKKVLFIDVDEQALESAKKNFLRIKSEGCTNKVKSIKEMNNAEFVQREIGSYNKEVEIVLQNPPFGTKDKGKDIHFLEKACMLAKIVYSFHKSETLEYIKGFADKKKILITHIWSFRWPLKQSYRFHSRRIKRINVSCLRFVRK